MGERERESAFESWPQSHSLTLKLKQFWDTAASGCLIGKLVHPRGNLHWANATITFSYESGKGEGQPEKYVEVRGMDTKYRIMPDAIVLTKALGQEVKKGPLCSVFSPFVAVLPGNEDHGRSRHLGLASL